jgi:hypothetical protein
VQDRRVIAELANPDFLPAAAPAVPGDSSPPPPPTDESLTTVQINARVVIARPGEPLPPNAKVDDAYAGNVDFQIEDTSRSSVRITAGGDLYDRADYYWTGTALGNAARPREWTGSQTKSVAAQSGQASAELTSLSFYGNCVVHASLPNGINSNQVEVPVDTDRDGMPDPWEANFGADLIQTVDEDPSGVNGNTNLGDGRNNFEEYAGYFDESDGAMKHRRGNPYQREFLVEVDVMAGCSRPLDAFSKLKDACQLCGIELHWVEDQLGIERQTRMTESQQFLYHRRWRNSSEYNRNGMLNANGEPVDDGLRDPSKPFALRSAGYRHMIFAASADREDLFGLAWNAFGHGYVFDDEIAAFQADGFFRGQVTLDEAIIHTFVHEVGHLLGLPHHDAQRPYNRVPRLPHWDGCAMHTGDFGEGYEDVGNGEDADPELEWIRPNPRLCRESHDPEAADPQERRTCAMRTRVGTMGLR